MANDNALNYTQSYLSRVSVNILNKIPCYFGKKLHKVKSSSFDVVDMFEMNDQSVCIGFYLQTCKMIKTAIWGDSRGRLKTFD